MSQVKVRWIVALAALVGGCGSDQNVTVGTSAAKGSVGGVVLDAAPGLPPLAGASVTVIAGGSTFNATTDVNGTFAVSDVPAGSVVVKLSSMGRFDVYLTQVLDSSAGNFPVSNAALTVGPIAMVSNKGAFSVRVVDENGAAVAGEPVNLRGSASYLDLSNGGVVAKGSVEASATSGMDGTAALAGLPDWGSIGPILPDTILLNFPPKQLQGAAGYEFLGLTLQVAATAFTGVFSQTPTVVLAGPRSPLSVLSSSLDWLESFSSGPLGSQVPASGPITVAFNQAIDPASVRVQLLTEFGAAAQAMPMPTVTGNLLSIAFSQPLDAGTRYNLSLHANATYRDQSKELDVTAPFFVPQAQGTGVSITNASRQDPDNPNDYIVMFSEPVGIGYGSVGSVFCVVFYEANLDGDLNTSSPGEWSGGGLNTLRCDNTHPGFELRPDEPQLGVTIGSPITGFTTRWRIAVHPQSANCYNGYACSVSNSTVHLVFSRNVDPNAVFKRSDGTPLPDMTFTMPALN